MANPPSDYAQSYDPSHAPSAPPFAYVAFPQYGYEALGVPTGTFNQHTTPQNQRLLNQLDIYAPSAPPMPNSASCCNPLLDPSASAPPPPAPLGHTEIFLPRYDTSFKWQQNVQYSDMRQELVVDDSQKDLGYNWYDGEKNSQGQRHGQGVFHFADGSTYKGEWKSDLRDGIGTYTGSGGCYRGQWLNDVKHGQGIFTYPNGDAVTGMWHYGCLNGLAKFKQSGASKEEHLIYKDDLKICNSRQGLTGSQVCYFIFAIGAMFVFYSALIVLLVVPQAEVIGFLAIFWIALLVISQFNNASRYIWNMAPVSMVLDKARTAVQSSPSCSFRISCYHYETRTTTTRDADGKTRTTTERHRVTTLDKSAPFHFTHWVDRSPPPETLQYLDVFHIARLSTSKEVLLSPQASHSWRLQSDAFLRRYMHYDTHHDFSSYKTISFMENKILVYNDQKAGGRPWWTSYACLILLDLVMLGWIQRLTMLKRCPRVTYQLEKYIMG